MGTRKWGLGGKDYVILMRQSLLLMLTVTITKKNPNPSHPSAQLQTDGHHFVRAGGREWTWAAAAASI